jgi:3-oxoadipate enol-lactonase
MPRLSVRDTELHYEDTGPGSTGQTLVLSHGLLWNTELFAHQARALSGKYRCIRYDHRGQGRSADDAGRSIDIGTVTADAIALIEALVRGPVHFVGLSMGGFVGMRIAARRPELLRSLTLLDTSADPEPAANIPRYRVRNTIARAFGIRSMADRVMPILFGKSSLEDPALASQRRFWKEQLLTNRRGIHRAVTGVIERETVAPELVRIRVPTLVLVGDEDAATGVDAAKRIHAGIAGSRYLEIPRAGHSAPVEQPEQVSAALAEFLDSVRAREAGVETAGSKV